MPNRGGYVFGVCNGFQILCEAGLVPGALLHNDTQKFICRNVNIRCETSNSLVTSAIEPGQVLTIPIAHGEGRFYASTQVLDDMQANDQVLFRYCDPMANWMPPSTPMVLPTALQGSATKPVMCSA
jgi:phosphoribosylformylglycinamidine (FGAM) synthase-like amidotransferase family enzyme